MRLPDCASTQSGIQTPEGVLALPTTDTGKLMINKQLTIHAISERHVNIIPRLDLVKCKLTF